MKVFELQFNPRNKEDRIIKSFIREPTGALEKRLGNLYMAGELNRAMPQSADFLDSLASLVQREYYSAGLKKSCEQSLQESFKKANDFLDVEVRKGNVNWLGNLNFAALSFNDFNINFTKVGDIKIFLVRNSQALDISESLEYENTNSYPSKVFGNIATGKLSTNDKIIIINANNENLLDQLCLISDEKGLKAFAKTKRQILSELSGICLLLIAGEGKAAAKFSFQKSFKLPSIPNPLDKFKISNGMQKRIILVLSLSLILTLGFFIFR